MYSRFFLSSFTFSGGCFDVPHQPWLSSLLGAKELTRDHESTCSLVLSHSYK